MLSTSKSRISRRSGFYTTTGNRQVMYAEKVAIDLYWCKVLLLLLKVHLMKISRTINKISIGFSANRDKIMLLSSSVSALYNECFLHT